MRDSIESSFYLRDSPTTSRDSRVSCQRKLSNCTEAGDKISVLKSAKLMKLLSVLLMLSSLGFAQQPSTAAPQVPEPHACQKDSAYHKIDFWVGDWNVFAKN